MVDDLADADAAAFEALVGRRAERVPLQHLVGTVGFRLHRPSRSGPAPSSRAPRPSRSCSGPSTPLAPPATRRRSSSTSAPAAAPSPSRSPTRSRASPSTRSSSTPTRSPGRARNAASAGGRRRPRGAAAPGLAEDALPELDGQLDLVASNPPYVATTEAHIPDPEVVDHDPGVALWAGEDGLDVVRLVEQAARRLLKPGGLVVVEHSDRQGEACPALLRARRAAGPTSRTTATSPAATASSPPAGPGTRREHRLRRHRGPRRGRRRRRGRHRAAARRARRAAHRHRLRHRRRRLLAERGAAAARRPRAAAATCRCRCSSARGGRSTGWSSTCPTPRARWSSASGRAR